MSHNLRSTKTRIETIKKEVLKPLLMLSQYKIHQNKDWNIFQCFLKSACLLSQYKIHQNKDWNAHTSSLSSSLLCHNIRSTKTRIETDNLQTIICVICLSQYKIHQNKDWNPDPALPWFAILLSQYKIHQNKDWNRRIWRKPGPKKSVTI